MHLRAGQFRVELCYSIRVTKMKLFVNSYFLKNSTRMLRETGNQASIPTRNFACYLHSTGGMLGEGTACDDDDGIDLCTSCASSASAASAVKWKDTTFHIAFHFFKGVLLDWSFQDVLSSMLMGQ